MRSVIKSIQCGSVLLSLVACVDCYSDGSKERVYEVVAKGPKELVSKRGVRGVAEV